MTEFEEEREVGERLGQLPREAEPTADLWPGIAPQLLPGPRWSFWSPIAQIAAALVIFAAGVGSGLAITAGREDPPPSVGSAMELAVEVQRTGTEYVAALAAFASIVDSLSADVRVQGREAALATLFGAAQELALLTGASGEPGGLGVGPADAGEPIVRF